MNIFIKSANVNLKLLECKITVSVNKIAKNENSFDNA